ncbi:MAG: hypothetical protein H6744_10580 [Deltaproteobacteria bacterium]|nr:hypothetical protein [Deltaproteobacteria bacterium]
MFEPTDGAELAVEVDPRVTTDGHIDALADLGFNRISLGVQDLGARGPARHRPGPELEDTARIIERAVVRAASAGQRRPDLGCRSRPRGLRADGRVGARAGTGPQRHLVFAYVPDQHRGHQRRIEPDDLPPAELKPSTLELVALARERFLEAGYEPIGMDPLRAPGRRAGRARREGRLRRNFQGYTR